MNHSNHAMTNMTMAMMNTTMSMVMMNNASMDHAHHHGNMSMGTTQDPHHGHDHHHDTTTMGGSGHEHGHGGGEMGHMPGHSMQMYFHAGVSEYILFENLLTTNVGGMVGACIVMFALSVIYEGLKYFREFLLRQSNLNRSNTYSPSTAGDNVVTKQPEVGARMLSGVHAIQTLLHMVQVFISYCLMLVFMTYNVYLCVAIIVGAGLGYFLFGWRRATVVDMNEHCH